MPWPIRPRPMNATRAMGLVHVLDRTRLGAEGALRQRRGHELVEVAVEHPRSVRGLYARAQILHHLIGLQHIGTDLVAPADVGFGGLVGSRLLLALLQLDLVKPRAKHVPGLRAIFVLRAAGL